MARRSDRHESGGGGPLIHSGGHRGSPVGFGRQTFTRTKDPTMTDEMMSLRTLLEKSIVIVEGLDLSAPPMGPYELRVLPLRLAGLDGAPARAVLVG